MPWPNLFAGQRIQANATQGDPPASSAAAQHGWWLLYSGSGLCLLQNDSDQRLATLDFSFRPILSRVRCIAWF